MIDRNGSASVLSRRRREVEEAIGTFSPVGNWDEAFGSRGTVDAVSEICAPKTGRRTITVEGLQRLRQGLLTAGDVKRIKFAGLKAERQE